VSRIVAISNRVAQPKRSKSSGGLAVGLLAALEKHGGIWFGWSGRTCSGEPGDAKLLQAGNIQYATIDINEQEYDAYYNGFSNNTLWPLLHFLLGFFSFSRANYNAYCRVNALFARKLLPLLEPDDVIWVHDYHLIPLAAELRRAGVEQPIGFFLHVPFPGFDVMRVLPCYEHILRSLASYDVVGFQTQRDLSSFFDCVTQPGTGGEVLDANRVSAFGRTLRAGVFPIGIDVDTCQKLAAEHLTDSQVERLARRIGDRNLIIGVDRLDYSKGLEERFRGYESLLVNYPAIRGRVEFLQIAPPTRGGVRAYDDIRHDLERAAGNINGRFADINWMPIRYLNRAYGRSVLMALLRLGSVGLVTPIRDGMNLVAKEYVASQDPDNPGMLVLSTLCGAAQELTEAVLVNPYDRQGVADGLHQAIEMGLEERRERHQAMLSTLKRYDIHNWSESFITALTSGHADKR